MSEQGGAGRASPHETEAAKPNPSGAGACSSKAPSSLPENLYGIATGPEDAPVFHYAGQTKSPIDVRWARHLKDARNPLTTKPLYEHMRHVGIDQFRIVFLDTTESGLVEADYVRALIEVGHPLLNANAGNKVVSKKRAPSVFTQINRQADERLDAIERRKRLHSDAQVLSKPELVRQRINGTIPDGETLAKLDWRACPPELMLWGKPPKNPDEIDAKLLKLGDYNVFIAFKTGKWAYWVKNTRTGQADAYKVNWRGHPKGFGFDDACKEVVASWPEFSWWSLGQH